MERPHIFFAIYQLQSPLALFSVIFELALVELPMLAQIIKITIVEPTFQRLGVLIVDFPFAAESVILPLALVGHFLVGIVESPKAVHRTLGPLPVVSASIRITEDSLAVAEATHLLALVNRTISHYLDSFALAHI